MYIYYSFFVLNHQRQLNEYYRRLSMFTVTIKLIQFYNYDKREEHP